MNKDKTPSILILGANGQLGTSLQKILSPHEGFVVLALNSNQYSILDPISHLRSVIGGFAPDIIVNCAAYTAVDLAEAEPSLAFKVNRDALSNLSLIANSYEAKLIHISTDFVFDGKKSTPYVEEDETSPLSIYGQSKREGELRVQKECNDFGIIRTSWLYSFSHRCFYSTMVKLGKERKQLRVVNDQFGCPTYVDDLSQCIVRYCETFLGVNQREVFHFSNCGEITWYDFAKKIFEVNNISIDLIPISTEEYPVPALRPKYSVLSGQKIQNALNISLKGWQESLKKIQ